MMKKIYILALSLFISTTVWAYDGESGVKQTAKFSYLRSNDLTMFRVEEETYRLNYEGYFDLYYGMGTGFTRKGSDKTIAITYYPHVGIRGYTKTAPFFEVGIDAFQIVFKPGNTYAWNKFDSYYKAGVSWELAPNVGMELFWQRNRAVFQKNSPANFVGWSMYVHIDK